VSVVQRAADTYPSLHALAVASFGYGAHRDECGAALAELDRLRANQLSDADRTVLRRSEAGSRRRHISASVGILAIVTSSPPPTTRIARSPVNARRSVPVARLRDET
jgi:hypothetical protein